MHNIERSGFHASEYVGYADGPWRIRKGYGGWIATKSDNSGKRLTARTLKEMSEKLANTETIRENPGAPSVVAKKGDFAILQTTVRITGITSSGNHQYETNQLVRVESASKAGNVTKYIPATFLYTEGGKPYSVRNIGTSHHFLIIPITSLNRNAFYDWIKQAAELRLALSWDDLDAARSVIGSFRKGVRI